MTNEEKRLITDCRIMVIATSDFIDAIKTELHELGFKSFSVISALDLIPEMRSVDIIAEYVDDGASRIKGGAQVPIIYPFDFVDGAGAIVIMPGDDNELQHKADMRLWAAQYITGYCAFWNVEGCDWLKSALPAISEGKTNEAAAKTAAHITSRIAANIAVGRKVKHFPKFYLYETKEM